VTLYRGRVGLAKRLEQETNENNGKNADAGNNLLFGKVEEPKCGAAFTDL
jgi:hypothetical protein